MLGLPSITANRSPNRVLLQPFGVACGALGLGAGPSWWPRPSPAAPGPRSNAAPAAEGSHSGHAGESQEDVLAAAAPLLSAFRWFLAAPFLFIRFFGGLAI